MVDEQEILADLKRRQDETWPEGIPKTVQYLHGEAPLTEYLRWRAETIGDKTAIAYYGGELTYAQLDQQSSALASFLIDRGLSTGDRVALMMQNCPQYIIAFWGVIKAGGVVVPVNPMFQRTELAYELNDSGAVIAFAQRDYVPMVDEARGGTAVREIVVVDIGEYADPATDIPVPFEPAPSSGMTGADHRWADVVRWQDDHSARFPRPDLDRLAALNYTGGTTGMPKGVEHTQRHMLYTAGASTAVRLMGSVEGGTVSAATLSFLPVFWIAGENQGVIAPIYSGGTCVLLTRWDPAAVLKSIERYRVANMSGTVDNYLELMARDDFDDYDLSSVTGPSTMSFVTKLSNEIRHTWSDRVGAGSVLREGAYGMTETHTNDTFVVGFQDGDLDLSAEPVFVGLPMPGTEIKICDFETGQICPIGTEGEILVRCPSLLTAYWQNPEATEASFVDGWFRTGDRGVFYQNGCLRYIGRNKEMLKVNGMSVFPTEIESLLYDHPAIAAAAVVGVPDPKRGERPRAYIEVAVGSPAPDPEELRQWARQHMAPYKVPEFVIVDALPKTTTGKIQKHRLDRTPTPSESDQAAVR